MWARVDGFVGNRVLTLDRANLKDDGAEDIEEVMKVAGVVAGCLDGMQCVGDEGADALEVSSSALSFVKNITECLCAECHEVIYDGEDVHLPVVWKHIQLE